MEDDKRQHWHVGREFPIATIVALLIQTAGVVWWAASTSAKVDFLKETNAAMHLMQSTIDRKQDDESRLQEVRTSALFERVNSKLDKLIEGKR